jgi:Flp pilus assembly pilin Flp
MVNRFRRFARDTVGAALVEYTLIVAGVALIGAAAVAIFGN